MTQTQSTDETGTWLGTAPQEQAAVQPAAAERDGAFNEGKLWFGRHAADNDILVFDPAETDPYSDRLSLYSLSQHRRRTFPRAAISQHIHALTDAAERKRAAREYGDRATGRQVHEDATAAAAAERSEGQRQSTIAAHRRHLARVGVEYQGVTATPDGHRPGRRTKCHDCGIGLDDFAGTVCNACNGVLCSCGACACGGPYKK